MLEFIYLGDRSIHGENIMKFHFLIEMLKVTTNKCVVDENSFTFVQ